MRAYFVTIFSPAQPPTAKRVACFDLRIYACMHTFSNLPPPPWKKSGTVGCPATGGERWSSSSKWHHRRRRRLWVPFSNGGKKSSSSMERVFWPADRSNRPASESSWSKQSSSSRFREFFFDFFFLLAYCIFSLMPLGRCRFWTELARRAWGNIWGVM